MPNRDPRCSWELSPDGTLDCKLGDHSLLNIDKVNVDKIRVLLNADAKTAFLSWIKSTQDEVEKHLNTMGYNTVEESYRVVLCRALDWLHAEAEKVR